MVGLPRKKALPPAITAPETGRASVRESVRHVLGRALLENYAPPCAVVDLSFQVLETFGPVDLYLKPSGRNGGDFLHRSPREVAAAAPDLLERARTDPQGLARQSLFVGEEGSRRGLDLVARRLPSIDPEAFVIFFDDHAPHAVDPAAFTWPDSGASARPVLVSAPARVAPAQSTPRGEAGRSEAPRVLIIEGHLDAAEGMRLLLELKGYRVALAHDGKTGLEKARQFRPAVVLCETGLRGGMDGYAVAKALRSEPGLTPIGLVGLTGPGSVKDDPDPRGACFDARLAKPTDPAALIRLLASFHRES